MTMTPRGRGPEDSGRTFAALAELAADNGLGELSMGNVVLGLAGRLEEGATIISLGSVLFV